MNGEIDHICGKCGAQYTFEQYKNLDRVKVKEDDPDPYTNYGYTFVCPCGYIFGKDSWHLLTDIHHTKGRFFHKEQFIFRVSTMFLEMSNFNTPDMRYETQLFSDKIEDYPLWRFKTQDEAKTFHYELVEAIKNKKFKLIPVEFNVSFKKLSVRRYM